MVGDERIAGHVFLVPSRARAHGGKAVRRSEEPDPDASIGGVTEGRIPHDG